MITINDSFTNDKNVIEVWAHSGETIAEHLKDTAQKLRAIGFDDDARTMENSAAAFVRMQRIHLGVIEREGERFAALRKQLEESLRAARMWAGAFFAVTFVALVVSIINF